MSSVSIYPYSQLNHNIFYHYKDKETTTSAKPSHKCTKSAASNANEPCKQHMTVGEGLDNVGNKMGGILETLDVIAHPNNQVIPHCWTNVHPQSRQSSRTNSSLRTTSLVFGHYLQISMKLAAFTWPSRI